MINISWILEWAFFLSVSNFSGLWTEFLKMDGIYENIRNFWDSAGKFRKNIWTEIGRKRTELSGKWTEIPGTPKSAKGCVASEADGKKHEWTEFPTESVWTKICVHWSSRIYTYNVFNLTWLCVWNRGVLLWQKNSAWRPTKRMHGPHNKDSPGGNSRGKSAVL